MARVLLVEDDPDMRPLLEHMILSGGHHVTPAANVTVGGMLLEAQPFDLLVTDVNLPDGSGLVLADRATAANLKALVVTGYGLRLGPGMLAPYKYLLKPVRAPELIAAITECLRAGEPRPKAGEGETG